MEESESYHKITQEADDTYSTDYGWGLYKEESDSKSSSKYCRTYTWNEKKQLISSVDSNYSTAYVYGQDGQRSNKYTQNSETLYFNKMWTLHTDSGNSVYGGQSAKNIYLGETRIVTKLNSGTNPTYQEEYYKQYFYHSDHLGSASLISDYKGNEYQRIEYTPYGETWVEKTQNTGLEYLPYKFTAKELDEETGLYYYGARYLDPKYSRWISTDPALGEYIPKAGKGTADEAGKLPGIGGAFNSVNLNLYHYAGNNPVKYIDPDGKQSLGFSFHDFINLLDIAGDPTAKLYNEMKRADSGDEYAKANLKYIFHEAGRETLKQASSKFNDMAIISLCLGCPEGTTVFGTAATVCDAVLAIDSLVTNLQNSKTKSDYLNAAKNFGIEGGIVIAGIAYSKFTGWGANKISNAINVKIGSTGRFYELGHSGAIKSKEGFRKLLMKDIASGFFGQEAIPNAPLIIQEAMKVYDAVKGSENEK